jgi:plastocyanin
MAGAEKSKWTRLAALGLFLAGLAPALMLAAALIWGLETEEGETIFFSTTTAVAWLGALLVWRFGAWAKILGIIAGIFVMMSMFWTAFGLAQPSSFFDFVPGVLLIPGALIAIVSCIAGLVSRRRGHLTLRAEGGEKRAIGVVVGIVVLAAAVSGALHLLNRSTASAAEAQASSTMRDFRFDEDSYEVAGGSRVFVRNDDPFFHTFTIDDLGVDEGFVAGSSKIIEIPARPGTYVLYCKPHTRSPEDPAEDDMAARITVS